MAGGYKAFPLVIALVTFLCSLYDVTAESQIIEETVSVSVGSIKSPSVENPILQDLEKTHDENTEGGVDFEQRARRPILDSEELKGLNDEEEVERVQNEANVEEEGGEEKEMEGVQDDEEEIDVPQKEQETKGVQEEEIKSAQMKKEETAGIKQEEEEIEGVNAEEKEEDTEELHEEEKEEEIPPHLEQEGETEGVQDEEKEEEEEEVKEIEGSQKKEKEGESGAPQKEEKEEQNIEGSQKEMEEGATEGVQEEEEEGEIDGKQKEEETDGVQEEKEEEEEDDDEEEGEINLDIACRRQWTHRNLVACMEHTGWKPYRPWWWEKQAYEHLDDVKYPFAECMLSELTEFRRNTPDCDSKENEMHEFCQVPATEPASIYRHQDDGEIVTIEMALTEQEAFSVQAVGRCIRKLLPLEEPYFEKRSFGYDTGDEVIDSFESGNFCTYVTGFLQLYAPGVAAQVMNLATVAWKTAEWKKRGLPDPNTLGIRTSEDLSYETATRLGVHKDDGSVYTIIIALSDQDEYEGGTFRLEGDTIQYKPNRLTALVIESHTRHGVMPVVGGKRQTFVTELWDTTDVPLGLHRPTQETTDDFNRDEWSERGKGPKDAALDDKLKLTKIMTRRK